MACLTDAELTQGRQRQKGHKAAWFGWVLVEHVPLLLLHSNVYIYLQRVQAFHTRQGTLLAYEIPTSTCLPQQKNLDGSRTVTNMKVRCQLGKEWRARRKYHLIPTEASETSIYSLLPMWSCGDCKNSFSGCSGFYLLATNYMEGFEIYIRMKKIL